MVKLGLIGCGSIGQRVLQALAHLPEASLVATADPDPDRAAQAALPFDAQSFESAEALMAAGLVDGVIIATPSGLHPPLAEAAMEQGLDVLVEKPLALSWETARRLTQFAEDAGLVLAVTHFNRMLPAVTRVLELVRDGYLGTLTSGGVAVRWARPQAYYDEAPWRGTRAMDGGILFNQAVHAIDLAVAVFGPAAEAHAYLATQTHTIETEDTVAGAVRFKSGALVTVAATTAVPERNLEERITVVGTAGTVVLGPTVGELLHLQGPDPEVDARVKAELASGEPAPGWRSHQHALQDFVKAVETRGTPALSARSTLDALAVVEALTVSGMSGRPVEVPGSRADGATA